MDEYIERKELLRIEKLLDTSVLRASKTASNIYDQMIYDIENFPSVYAIPVRHGRWNVENEYSIRCSECCFNRASIKMPLDYCPNCGAKMDGGEDDAAD